MRVSGWTVRETLTKSICNFREHYHADFLEIHAEYFLEKMKQAFMLSHFLGGFVGFLGRRASAENTAQRTKGSLKESIYSSQVHHQLNVSESF